MRIFSTPLSRNSKERLEHTENHKKQVVKPWPCMFSQLFSPIKVKIVDKMMQSAYLCVILFVKYNKLALLAVLTWFLILGKKQNGDHCRWRHMPPVAPPPIKYIPHLVEKIKGFPLKNSRVGFHQSPLYHTVRVWICVSVQGLSWDVS